MNFIKIVCPSCNTEAKLSLADSDYFGPRRCWKCREYFTITIHNGSVTSCEPLSAEEYERQQEELKAKERAKSGRGFSTQAQMEFPQADQAVKAPANEDKIDIFNILAGKSKGGIDITSQAKPTSYQAPPVNANPPAEAASPGKGDINIFDHLVSKNKSGADVPRQSQPTASQNPPPPTREFIRPPMPKAAPANPVNQPKPEKPASGKPEVFPPERFRVFVPIEENIDTSPAPKETKKPKKDSSGKDIPPLDKVNFFIPPQT